MQLFFASCSLSMTVLRKESLYKTDGLPMGKEFWCLAVFHCPKFLRKFLKIMETSKILGTYSQISKTISIDLTIKECIVRIQALSCSTYKNTIGK